MRVSTCLLAVITVPLFAMVATVAPAAAVSSFFQGFETDTSNWNDFGGTTARVPSGTDGIASSSGANHAVIDGSVYTNWGGYESVFPADGYVTSIDVYLDMALADGSDKRFDFSSAINQPDGTHQRDFIFHLGTNASAPGQWLASASNNAPGWPGNPQRNPVDITESGWYTLRHTFEDDGGMLKVTLDLLDGGTVIGTWVLSDPSNSIGATVGGNRYGWITSQRFDFDELAIDNSEKQDVIPPPAPIQYAVGQSTYKLCVERGSGRVLSPVNGNCRPGSFELATPSLTPYAFCINPYTGSVALLSGRPCNWPHRVHVVPDNGDLHTCVSLYTGANRRVASPAQCGNYERPNLIPAG